MKDNIIIEKAEGFADRIVRMCSFLKSNRKASKDIVNQILRSGTSIGANIAESQYAQSRPDFISKLSIALKEANETKFWLNRIHTAGYLSDKEYESVYFDNIEIIRILTSITKSLKQANGVSQNY
jgi:four helix bundle protein